MTLLETAARASGWYYGWNIVIVCVLSGIAANALPINAFSLFLKTWSAEFHVPISTLQLGLAALGLSGALLSPVIGILADKYPARLLFGIGLAGLAVFHVGISLVNATWQYFLLFLIVLPVPLALTTSLTANPVVSRWFTRNLGLALGITSFGLGLGGVIVPPIIAATMPEFGWRAIWRVAAALTGIVLLPLALAVLRDRPSARDGFGNLIQPVVTALSPGSSEKTELSARAVFTNRTFWILVIVYVPILVLHGACGQNLAPIAASRGLDQQTAGLLLSLYSFAQLIANLAVGALADRFGIRVPLTGLALSAAIGGVFVATGTALVPLTVGVVLVGIGAGFWPLIAAAIATEFGPGAVGRVFGLIALFIPLSIVGPFSAARLQEATASYAPALIPMAVLCAIGGAICAVLMRAPDRSA